MANIKVGVIDNDCMAKVADVCTSDELCAFFVASATSLEDRIGFQPDQVRCRELVTNASDKLCALFR